MILHESDYEAAFISHLTATGWHHLNGSSIPGEAIYSDDTQEFLSRTCSALSHNDIRRIIDTLRTVSAESDFAALHAVHTLITDGMTFTPENGITSTIQLIDYANPSTNIFRAVNQLSIDYRNNGQASTRRPDILLYVNGIPLCTIELKNPAGDNDTALYDAWDQIYTRYWRDIPHLLKYCPLACISDGVRTRLGTVRTPYEHFYAWRKVNEDDEITTAPFTETLNMIHGVFRPERFIEILRDYVYFPDSEYDKEENAIVCRYPQYFASKSLRQSITEAIKNGDRKGGTYFGATGCGKTYAMMFLARQLSMRTKGIGSPTIVMIVDRTDLQNQGAKLFTKSGEFLGLGEVKIVDSRNTLKQELGARDSGGFYICTVQKFCDGIGELNTRNNIVCFSDEAHRTQIERAQAIQFSRKDNAAYVSSSYAKTLHDAFPNAVFVGFTGTPIQATYETFGRKVDEYTMGLAVADGLTVPIRYHPGIFRVTLDKVKAEAIEDYYRKCEDDGATPEAIAASKRAMSSMEVLIGEKSRLERLADDIYSHFTESLAN
ncbi:MAG: HsdR family type I site-specific deoxyribonuclease, partial [Synergistaceae bacterium]|nr:HsdR family type I site-specific deoxyribonuclease [Synergistaceae bacterium]